MPPLSSSPPRCRHTDKHSSRALHAVPFATMPLRRVSTHALPPCRAINSFLSLGAARIASTQCTAIKGGHHRCLVRASTVSASGKPSPLHSPLDSDTPSVPSHLTPPFSPCAGLRASPEPRAASQPKGLALSPSLSSSVIVHTGELCSSVARLPHRELELPTV
jgi:hypothetical protein